MTPRVAISQAHYDRDVGASLARTLNHLERARQLGAELVVFPEWFLGLNPPEPMPSRTIEALAEAARRLGLGVVTGTLRVLDPTTGAKEQRALVLDQDGSFLGSQAKCDLEATERPWFEPGDGIQPVATRWGRLVLLLGPDAVSPARWVECRRAGPALVVMATGAHTAAEQRELENLALSRSLETHALVVLVPLRGRFGGATYVGAARAFHRGRALGPEAADQPVVLVTDTPSVQVEPGVVDVASWAPGQTARPADWELTPEDLRRPEAERRVLLDWSILQSQDPEVGGRALLRQAADTPRQRALAPAHPDHPRMLETLLVEGAGGAFAWPAAAGRRADDPTYRVLAAVLNRYRRPLVVRTGAGPGPFTLSHPEHWDPVLLAYPDLPVVMVSSGVASPFLEEALALAEYRSNVWLELSFAPEVFWDAARERVGAARLLFGSGGIPGRFGTEWARLKAWAADRGVRRDEWAAMAEASARRLFFGAAASEVEDRPAADAVSV
jgi:predicted amidohydrolase